MAERIPFNGCKRRLVKAAQAEFDRVFRDMRPMLEARGLGDNRLLQINAAQNTLRTCLEATLNRLVPYDSDLLVELAIRLASYSISAAPIEDQEILVAKFMGAFAESHMLRISEGKVISTVWEMADGRDQPNFPKEPSNG